jgi:hypothetical protein
MVLNNALMAVVMVLVIPVYAVPVCVCVLALSSELFSSSRL